eukprot:CAMPEP_0116920746 /NCGR_PEP_ID=MMETSP0467-20121206/21209_1 /TAXON_ID=283647 /ORGANISM="Mesodinium pulex, Strain SPMC105" /LENGTH=85 /DNA_ID=CAMNT_0004598663 /DNA_START=329 /DNA_END=586 /DNA_ORIENTATION=+
MKAIKKYTNDIVVSLNLVPTISFLNQSLVQCFKRQTFSNKEFVLYLAKNISKLKNQEHKVILDPKTQGKNMTSKIKNTLVGLNKK